MSARKWYVNEALASVRRLVVVVDELTRAEVHACLDLEASTTRRRSVTDRLIARAVQLEATEFKRLLTEKYHGSST